MDRAVAHPNPGADIAVVVVTHASEETIDECLQRLRAAEGVGQIRVVDNASSDDTLAIVQRHALADARVRFIANPDNPGFAAACNQGAADCRLPWLAFVNPDCFLEPDTLVRLRGHAQALGGALVGADLIDEAGMRDPAARRADPVFWAMLCDPRRSALGLPVAEHTPLQPVPAVSGALLLLPRVLFAQVGGFDPGYRLHVEDLDLCRRVRQVGATVACANDVRVVHLRGISSRGRRLFVEWHKHRGLWRYFCRYEAAQRRCWQRGLVWVAVWLHFPLAMLSRPGRRTAPSPAG
ncbi:glycosyltransferase family 2 protein [Thermomonas hydrothermalis]|uniref:glycosyltransferase family 2 protein n=1 Tax=Thermomonas hydrothermalis TaxID=213588 RepID=UPI000932BF71|nr:glycosyltransferase family 2 protein [Thermomonas hydrothermalis]MCL6619501.1 glycosyltransferase family 2 protein [Thermomonas hydrothermalis]